MKNKRWITYGFFLDKSKFVEAGHSQDHAFVNKPGGGLWASPVDSEYGWKRWCIGEDFRTDRLKLSTSFRLSKNAKVLTIDSYEDFLNILDKYGELTSWEWNRVINWNKIKQDYDAVYLTDQGNIQCHYPRLSRSREDLNSWDVESIVILRWSAIDEKSFIKERYY